MENQAQRVLRKVLGLPEEAIIDERDKRGVSAIASALEQSEKRGVEIMQEKAKSAVWEAMGAVFSSNQFIRSPIDAIDSAAASLLSELSFSNKEGDMLATLIEVESWWIEDGMRLLGGAPHCIFAVREMLNRYAPHDMRRITTGAQAEPVVERPLRAVRG